MFNSTDVNSQSFNDGPIELQTKLREVQGNFAATDEALLGIGFAPDELTFKIWAKDNLGIFPWTGGSCLQDNNFTPTIGGSNSIDFNTIFTNFSFPNTTVPQYLDLRIDAWEDDLPSDGLLGFCANGSSCTWEDMQCCGFYLFGFCVGIETGDDYRCDANPFFQGLSYRNGPPCQWYSHGYINGSGCVNASSQPNAPNTDGYYKPHIETYWRYTKGTSFSNSIDLGTLSTGVITHFNSNECYVDYYNYSTGNDVIYSFNISSPTGVSISLCGSNGAQFDSYLYLLSDTNSIPIASNDNNCGLQSELTASLCTTGTYYIVVDATSPTEKGVFTLTIDDDPANTFSNTITVINPSCDSYSDGSITSNLNGGVGPFSFTWYDFNTNNIISNVNSNNPIDSINNLQAGTYWVEVFDNTNCLLSDTVTVISPASLQLSLNKVDASCNGFSDGQASVLVSGGSPSYNYQWNTSPVQNGPVAVLLSAGSYSLTVTDINNCTESVSFSINEPVPVPVSILNVNTDICDGGSVNLIASGASTYSWSPPTWLSSSIGNSVVSTPNASITYIVTGVDNSGCLNTDTISINLVQSISISVNPSNPSICEGEGIQISVSGASFYDWYPSNGLNATNGNIILANPLSTTNYNVVGTDNFGCSDTLTVQIDVLPAPIINVTDNPTICEGGSTPLSATGATSYSWHPPVGLNSSIGSLVTANPSVSTLYNVIGTAINGCMDSAVTTVSVNPNPVLVTFPFNPNICMGDSISINVSGADNYIWSPSSSLLSVYGDTNIAFPIQNTSYSIMGTDSLGCSTIISTVVNVDNLPIISVSASSSSICLGDVALLSATGANNYIWEPPFSLNTNVGSMVSATPNDTTIYSVTGTDINDCKSTASQVINVSPLPVISVTPNLHTICEGDIFNMNVVGANTYIWSPALGLSTTIGNQVNASPQVNTTYIVTGTDTNGCSDAVQANIIVNPNPSILVQPSIASICEGASINATAFGAVNYNWSPNIALNTSLGSSIIANPSNSVTYSVSGTDVNGCIGYANFQLNVGVNPSVTLLPSNPIICSGESVLLTASGADFFSWEPSSSLSSDIGSTVVANPQSSTTYQVIGIDSISCIDTSLITVNVIPLPSATIVSPNTSICSGDSVVVTVNLTGTPPWNLIYTVNGAVQPNLSVSNSPYLITSYLEGNYIIPSVIDANNCANIGAGSTVVDILNTPQASFSFSPQPTDILQPEINFVNHSIFVDSWYWDFGDGFTNNSDFNVDYSYLNSGDFTVNLVAFNGLCSDTATAQLVINPVYTLYVPDIFTPNNDGLNDYFQPKGLGIDRYEILIYNRWGEKVFKSEDINDCWNGSFNNNNGKRQNGIYTYVIFVTDEMGVKHELTGDVLLD